MEISTVDSQTIKLLSQITGKNLSEQEISPSVIFLANLVNLLLGVIMVDREFATAEKQQLTITLNQLIPSSVNLRSFTQLLITGISKYKTYKKSQAWKVLTAALAQPEKFVLIGLGFKMSAADGHMNNCEQKYLQKIAQFFNISPQDVEFFINYFSNGDCNNNVLKEIQCYLEPSKLLHLNPVCAQTASNLLLSLSFQEQTNNPHFALQSVLPTKHVFPLFLKPQKCSANPDLRQSSTVSIENKYQNSKLISLNYTYYN